MKKAVNVGYVFNVFDEKDLIGINLHEINAYVKFHGDIYKLNVGNTFEDSRKIDDLMDKYGEFNVLDSKYATMI